jgi:hypothetical protein
MAAALVAGAWLAVSAAPAAGATPTSCPGKRPIHPTRVVTGSFGTAQQGSYVMVPFRVPRGVSQVRVRYCYDQPESGSDDNTLDLGIYDRLRRGDDLWGRREFRGWGGSSHPEVAISPQGFSSDRVYRADPKGYVPGRTTRGFEPGPVRPGRWAAELGVAAVIPASAGNADGRVAWRLEIELSHRKAFAAHPYRPARYRSAPVRRRPGWYQGDFHVHDEQSNLGAATIAETLRYAFRPLAHGGAGLDFTALSDYVTDTAWGEIGRYQPRYPKNLVIPSAEVITYRGHLANQDAGGWVDYRTGPILERRAGGALRRLRGPTPPRKVFAAVHRLGGFTVINHPRIFSPGSPSCRGCYWEYTDRQTGLGRVDAIEVMNSLQRINATSPNPFTPPALDYWEHALGLGDHVAALGGSDTHDAGRLNGSLSSPLGRPATVVHARDLSARSIARGVLADHTYVKAFGAGGPDLRLAAWPQGHRRQAGIMGDTVRAGRVRIAATVLRARGGLDRTLELHSLGRVAAAKTFSGRRAALAFTARRRGPYFLELRQGPFIEAVSSPVWVRR